MQVVRDLLSGRSTVAPVQVNLDRRRPLQRPRSLQIEQGSRASAAKFAATTPKPATELFQKPGKPPKESRIMHYGSLLFHGI